MYWCAAPETSCGYAERDRWVLRRTAALCLLRLHWPFVTEAPARHRARFFVISIVRVHAAFLNNIWINRGRNCMIRKNHETLRRVLCFAMSPRPTLCLAIATVIGAHFTGASNCEAHVTIITCSDNSLGPDRDLAGPRAVRPTRSRAMLHKHLWLLVPKLTDGEAGRVAPCVWCLAGSPWQRL
jgi:hypothetical protein